MSGAESRRGRLAGWIGDALAVAGAGSTLAFLLAGWWMPALSPLPWLSRGGPAVAVGGAAVAGLLLGLRAGTTARAAGHALAALALGALGQALTLAAPALSGLADASPPQALAMYTASRLFLSLLLAGPAALLGAAAGAALSTR